MCAPEDCLIKFSCHGGQDIYNTAAFDKGYLGMAAGHYEDTVLIQDRIFIQDAKNLCLLTAHSIHKIKVVNIYRALRRQSFYPGDNAKFPPEDQRFIIYGYAAL